MLFTVVVVVLTEDWSLLHAGNAGGSGQTDTFPIFSPMRGHHLSVKVFNQSRKHVSVRKIVDLWDVLTEFHHVQGRIEDVFL